MEDNVTFAETLPVHVVEEAKPEMIVKPAVEVVEVVAPVLDEPPKDLVELKTAKDRGVDISKYLAVEVKAESYKKIFALFDILDSSHLPSDHVRGYKLRVEKYHQQLIAARKVGLGLDKLVLKGVDDDESFIIGHLRRQLEYVRRYPCIKDISEYRDCCESEYCEMAMDLNKIEAARFQLFE